MKLLKLNKIIMLCGLISAFNLAAAETAGRVLVAVGEVTAERNGAVIALKLGSPIESGDVLRTGTTSNAQVRMTDGGIIALRPQTELHLDEYHFAGQVDGTEKNFFSLIKGGFRTITGFIGKVNHSSYSVRTKSATIGIRGTDFSVVICAKDCGGSAKDGLYGGVFSGQINVSNQGGDKNINRSEGFYVADTHTPPQTLITPPSFVADKLAAQSRNQKSNKEAGKDGESESAKAEGGEEENSQIAQATVAQAAPVAVGSTGAVVTPAVAVNTPYVAAQNVSATTSGSAVLTTAAVNMAAVPSIAVFAYSNGGTNTSSAAEASATNTLTASAGKLISYRATYSATSDTWSGQAGVSFADKAGAVVDGSNVVWGRWLDGSVTDPVNGTLTVATLPSGVQYVYGDVLTPSAVIDAKSGLGIVTYTFAGGPSVTDSAGNVGTTMSGDFRVNFTLRAVKPNIVYTVGGSTYNITGFEMPVVNRNGGTAFGTGSIGNINIAGTSCTGGGCTGGTIDTTQVIGVFVGATGKGIITSVSTYTAANNTNTAAAGVFKAP
ncbi:MAG: FecR domain-containing protein [Gallionellaceae bacterium]|nr:FecR domain-containing protein [Gallionellaceae bacterium]